MNNKRKSAGQYSHGDVPAILEFLENSLDKEDKKMLKRVKQYIKALENKNATLEAQQKALVGEMELPPTAKPLLDKYAGNFTTRNHGQDSLEWILKLIVKDATIKFDHKERDTKLSKVAFYERKDNFLERGFNKVDKVLDAVTKKKKIRAIAATAKSEFPAPAGPAIKIQKVSSTSAEVMPVTSSTVV